jgi:hypothetical protein
MLQTFGLADEASGTAFRPLYEWLGSPYRYWEFDRSNVDETAEQLADAIEEAMPQVAAVASDEAVEAALSAWAFADTRRLRLPALLLVCVMNASGSSLRFARSGRASQRRPMRPSSGNTTST